MAQIKKRSDSVESNRFFVSNEMRETSELVADHDHFNAAALRLGLQRNIRAKA